MVVDSLDDTTQISELAKALQSPKRRNCTAEILAMIRIESEVPKFLTRI